jgi:hypothetical protein
LPFLVFIYFSPHFTKLKHCMATYWVAHHSIPSRFTSEFIQCRFKL